MQNTWIGQKIIECPGMILPALSLVLLLKMLLCILFSDTIPTRLMMGYLTCIIYTKFISIAHGNEKCGETKLDHAGHSYTCMVYMFIFLFHHYKTYRTQMHQILIILTSLLVRKKTLSQVLRALLCRF